jgi:KaiC/GvpD/RAD55 family RecA-like ATPase
MKNPLKSVSLKELLTRPFPPREYVIDPWLRNGEVALVWAASGLGKTMLTLSLAIAMAGGGRIWNWSCPRPRKVLIIDGEMNIQDLKDRIELLSKLAVDGIDHEALNQNLHIIARQDQDPDHDFYDITKEETQKAIRERCSREAFEVLIIDNLSTVADSLQDENEATAFRSVQSFLLQMKAMNLTTFLVHHARKSGDEPRGSTGLLTVFEVAIGLKPSNLSVPGKASFTLSFGKFRSKGGEATASRSWMLSDNGWVVDEDPDDVVRQLVDAIKSFRFASQKELTEHFGLAKSTISKRIQKAIGLELISPPQIADAFKKATQMRETTEADFDLDSVTEMEVPF